MSNTDNKNTEKEKITEALQGIEPSADAKERMYANVLKKASEQQTAPKSRRKITYYVLPAAACLCVMAVGLVAMQNSQRAELDNSLNQGYTSGLLGETAPDGSADNEGDYVLGSSADNEGNYAPGSSTGQENDAAGGMTMIGNPIQEVDGPGDFASIGISIEAPTDSLEAEYFLIDGNLASVEFVWKEHAYTYRASEQSGDFSGLYGQEISDEQIDSEHDGILTELSDGESTYFRVIWTDGKVNYSLSNMDSAAKEEVKELALSLMKE